MEQKSKVIRTVLTEPEREAALLKFFRHLYNTTRENKFVLGGIHELSKQFGYQHAQLGVVLMESGLLKKVGMEKAIPKYEFSLAVEPNMYMVKEVVKNCQKKARLWYDGNKSKNKVPAAPQTPVNEEQTGVPVLNESNHTYTMKQGGAQSPRRTSARPSVVIVDDVEKETPTLNGLALFELRDIQKKIAYHKKMLEYFDEREQILLMLLEQNVPTEI